MKFTRNLYMHSLKPGIPNRGSKMQTSVSQHTSAEAPIEKNRYQNWDSPEICICTRWNPESQTEAQHMIFCKPTYFGRSPNRKDALEKWDPPKICVCICWNPESQTHAQNMISCKPARTYFSRSPNRKDALQNWDSTKICICIRWNPESQTDAQHYFL